MNVQIFHRFHGLSTYYYRCSETGWLGLFVMDDFGNTVEFDIAAAVYSLC